MELRRIKKFETLYLAGTDGSIYSIRAKRFMKAAINTTGYPMVLLQNKGNIRPVKIHRVIAETFIPNPENKPQINHKNGIKTDNRVENLEWCTGSENIQHSIHSIKTFPVGENRNESKLTNDNVREIKRLLREGFMQKELAKKFGVAQATICKIATGKMWRQIA